MIHRVLKYIAFVEMIGFLTCIFPVMFLFAKYNIFGIIGDDCMRHVYTSIDIGSDAVKVVVCELCKNKLNLLGASSI